MEAKELVGSCNPASCPNGVAKSALLGLTPKKDGGWDTLSPLRGGFTSRRPRDGTDEADKEGGSGG